MTKESANLVAALLEHRSDLFSPARNLPRPFRAIARWGWDPNVRQTRMSMLSTKALCPAKSDEPPPGAPCGTTYLIEGEAGPRIAAVISDHWSLFVGQSFSRASHTTAEAKSTPKSRWGRAGRSVLLSIVPDELDLDGRHYPAIDASRMIPKRLSLLPETVRQALIASPREFELTGRADWDEELHAAIEVAGLPDADTSGEFRRHSTTWAKHEMRRSAVLKAFVGN
jgi:hypothetical protein